MCLLFFILHLPHTPFFFFLTQKVAFFAHSPVSWLLSVAAGSPSSSVYSEAASVHKEFPHSVLWPHNIVIVPRMDESEFTLTSLLSMDI